MPYQKNLETVVNADGEVVTVEVGPPGGAERLAEEHTKQELYGQAQDADVEGRSDMSKDELAESVAKKTAR